MPVVPERLDEVIRPSSRQSAAERLAIYHRAYFARLIECLAQQYPMLCAAAGDEVFAQFALAYLEAHPSRSYTLGELGRYLPEFLQRTRPRDPASEDGTHTHGAAHADDAPAVLVELARLEWLLSEVFDGPGSEATGHAPPHTPAEFTPQLRLLPCPSLRLIALEFPLDDYYAALRRGESPPLPPRERQYLAVVRRDYRVRRYVLGRIEYELLWAIVAGEPLAAAIEQAVACQAASAPNLDDPDRLAAALHRWFFAWSRAGFFIGAQ